MTLEEFNISFEKYLDKLNISLNKEQILKFYKYMNILIEWNRKLNLTAIIDPEDIIVKHFIDSLTISKYIGENSKLIDVGTGAGFPGIPLKIYREDLKVTLLDSLNKRINFLDFVIDELELKKIESIHGRAEENAHKLEYREKFDVVTSRAVANMATLSEYLIPYLRDNGIVLAMKGSTIHEELENADVAIRMLGGRVKSVEEFNLPDTEIKRNIVIIEKIRKTPNKYPRKPGTPLKEPLR